MMKDNFWIRGLNWGAIHAPSIYQVRTMDAVGAPLGTVVSSITFVLPLPPIEVRSNLRTEAILGRNA